MKIDASRMRKILNLYWVAGTQDCHHLGGEPEQNLLLKLEDALKSGITCYQFREKGAGALSEQKRIHELALKCRDLCRRHGVAFVINNDVKLALDVAADGVHIGQKDMALSQAIRLCRNKLFLGVSHANLEQIKMSLQKNSDIDYFACGPIFSTVSKSDAEPATGLNFIQTSREIIGDKPLVAIGGIDVKNVQSVRMAGADGVAVISAISKANHMGEAIKRLRSK